VRRGTLERLNPQLQERLPGAKKDKGPKKKP
jgi:hypothetical protein